MMMTGRSIWRRATSSCSSSPLMSGMRMSAIRQPCLGKSSARNCFADVKLRTLKPATSRSNRMESRMSASSSTTNTCSSLMPQSGEIRNVSGCAGLQTHNTSYKHPEASDPMTKCAENPAEPGLAHTDGNHHAARRPFWHIPLQRFRIAAFRDKDRMSCIARFIPQECFFHVSQYRTKRLGQAALSPTWPTQSGLIFSSSGMGSAMLEGVELLQIGEVGKGHHRGAIRQARQGQRNDPAVGPAGLAPFPEAFRSGGIDAAGNDAPDAVAANACRADVGELGEMRLAAQLV